MRLLFLLACAVLSVLAVTDTPGDRAKALVAQMTTDEKIEMLHGTGTTYPYVGMVPANSRLNIPALNLEDGPNGVADSTTLVTAWPSTMTVVASWNLTLMNAFGQAMGTEQRMKGSNVMLGPGVNIARVPVNGRNFEYLGEDPFLAYQMAYAVVQGIQSQGVIACVKHFVDNNQEGPGHNGRLYYSANVSERAQHELYYPPFKGAIDAGVGSVMCSYNKIANTYACENAVTLGDLKGALGFTGWVVSDWGATHSTVAAANAGLDQEMAGNGYFGAALKAAVTAGDVTMDRINDMVVRVLTPMFAIGLFDGKFEYGNITANVTSEEHNELALLLAEESTVLLKNSNDMLPLQPSKIKTIAVIGDAQMVHGSGSGAVLPPYVVTPLQGLQRYLTSISSQIQVSDYSKVTPDCPSQCADQIPVFTDDDIAKSVALAQKADITVLSVAISSGEGYDRTNLSLGDSQNKLVQSVLAVQSNTIVVVRSVGAVEMPWLAQANAVLLQLMPGQEAGNALARILFGEVNPSGKLPVTFPVSMDKSWLTSPEQYPGVNNNVDYSEDLLVGYKWFDAMHVQPLFPFGYGLSYTEFAYSSLSVDNSSSTGDVTVTFTVSNVGMTDGAEVAQVYLAFPLSAGEPLRLLKGFSKQFIAAGSQQQFTVVIANSEFAVWSEQTHQWTQVSGIFGIAVGASSMNLHLSTTITRP